MQELSALFVTKVAAEVKRISAEREAAAKAEAAKQVPVPAGVPESKSAGHAVAKAKALPAPIDVVLAGHLHLRAWAAQGFFNLEWPLVKELHASGLKWGAIFPDPDLHHFELA